MLNVSFKIFTKVLANRISSIACKVIRPSQTTFIPGRYILEIIHELKRKKQKDIILKLDFKKAYDKVNWAFLHQVLRPKDFSNKWCQLIEKLTQFSFWKMI
jgi:hypothetical protein